MTTTPSPGSGRHLPIRARRVKFTFPSGARHHHFVDNDLVMSHFVAVLSSVFPEGEDFFIRSVRNYSDQITDPQLQQDIKGFIGQESSHKSQHRMLNERLQAMGYPTAKIDRHVKRRLSRAERVYSTEMRLAATAALEHYTATFAEILLNDDDLLSLLDGSDVRSILLWHAFEEAEHKAVAFDVYQAVGGSERNRVRAMRIATTIFIIEMVLQTTRSLLRDPATYNPVRLLRSLNKFRKSPLFSRDALRRYASYTRPGFHPNDWDSTATLEHWSDELLDASGRPMYAEAPGG
ncbi:metal-dependent hydrolase [Mycolicibacillus parakoreensis]|uniref:Metal-dependent hydrolase n=1 Tax=Mycolicibacillus parakoreensis TaxID=1069221 RepID=A0ABY3U3U6_9MYCO|nr:metal-dependent hydrolase [Mycolicibacillus parakoreensis]MCV7313962.1 metal-dependent hydrolase [Mycolicibacillus parakoreensis]ULN54168.1 metal-dependent hydrolase [Mycolicibacillus parakoreensis]